MGEKYVSERVVNISEIESYISKAYIGMINLSKAVDVNYQNIGYIRFLIKSVQENISKAHDFEFCVERRTTFQD